MKAFLEEENYEIKDRIWNNNSSFIFYNDKPVTQNKKWQSMEEKVNTGPSPALAIKKRF